MTFIDINIIEGQNEKELITFHDISSLLLWLSLGITYHIHILYAYDFVSLKRFYDFPFIFQATHLWVGSCLFIWPSAIYLVYVAEWYSICLYVNENSWIWNDILNIACLEYLCILQFSLNLELRNNPKFKYEMSDKSTKFLYVRHIKQCIEFMQEFRFKKKEIQPKLAKRHDRGMQTWMQIKKY